MNKKKPSKANNKKISDKSVKSVESKIKKALEKIRPQLQADRGDVKFVGWDKKTGVVKVSLTGMCAGCPMAHITLKEGIEAEIKKYVPEVKEVENV